MGMRKPRGRARFLSETDREIERPHDVSLISFTATGRSSTRPRLVDRAHAASTKARSSR